MKLRSLLLIGILILLTVLGFNPFLPTQTVSAAPVASAPTHPEATNPREENYHANGYESAGREKGRLLARKSRELGQIFRGQGQAIGQYYKAHGRENRKVNRYPSLTLEEIYHNWGRGLYW